MLQIADQQRDAVEQVVHRRPHRRVLRGQRRRAAQFRQGEVEQRVQDRLQVPSGDPVVEVVCERLEVDVGRVDVREQLLASWFVLDERDLTPGALYSATAFAGFDRRMEAWKGVEPVLGAE